jgi:chloride channel protein, CIC family
MTRSDAGDRALGDFTADTRIVTLALMAAPIGVLSTFVAFALVRLIGLFTNLAYFHRLDTTWVSPGANTLGPWAVGIPVLGGVIVGLMARYGSEKIRGHGIPEAMEAILIGRSRIQPKVALLKPLSSAIAIGTGGPFGAEGPIIATGGALGSLVAQAFHLSTAERKTLLVAGAAAGMAAIFGTPVAAVLLAIELLLFEWKPRSFIPVACAAAVASVLRAPLFGAGPLFPVPAHTTLSVATLGDCLVIGLAAGVTATLVTSLLYGIEDAFSRLPLHWMWWPAVGGAFVGVGGLIAPRALGVGYDVIHDLLAGHLVGAFLLGLLVVKALIWGIGLGSGTSGGVLAPLLIMGGALGALGAHWVHSPDAGLWAMVGMAALMGGTMQMPFTAIVLMLELTGDAAALPGLLVGCIAAATVTVLVMKRSILTEKLARRGQHVMREYAVNPLHLLRVEEVMEPVIVEPTGVPSVTVYADELLSHALTSMLEYEVEFLPVVRRDAPERVIGYVERSGVMAAWVASTQRDGVREAGWLTAHMRRLQERLERVFTVGR